MLWQEILIIVLAIWALVLTVLLGIYLNFFNKLRKSAGEVDLKKVLDEILKKEAGNTQDIDRLDNEINWIKEHGLSSVQKIGLVRFNPFDETGGDHSFTLALLDGKENGFVLTGLHTRERTRVYVKEVKGGKTDIELSAEERKALVKAQKG